jgi:hypothetical protein
VSHNSWKQLVLNFQRSGRMWTKKNYMKLAKEEESRTIFLLRMWENLNSNSSNYEVWSLFGPLDFFFSWTWHLIFQCVKNVREGIKGLAFLRTKSREMMKESSDFRSGCSGSHHLC